MSPLDDKLAQWRRETDVDPSPALMAELAALAAAPPTTPPSAWARGALLKKVLVISALAVLGFVGARWVSAPPEPVPPSVVVGTPVKIAQPAVMEGGGPAASAVIEPARVAPVMNEAVPAPQTARLLSPPRRDGGSISPRRAELAPEYAAPGQLPPSEPQQLMALPRDGG